VNLELQFRHYLICSWHLST